MLSGITCEFAADSVSVCVDVNGVVTHALLLYVSLVSMSPPCQSVGLTRVSVYVCMCE